MSNVQLGSTRTPHDLTHFVFTTGSIGCLKVLSHSYVLPGDSVDINAIGSFRLSPLRRGLSVDCKLELFSFYVPFRYNYGNELWNDFLLKGTNGAALVAPVDAAHYNWMSQFLGVFSKGADSHTPFPLADSYLRIWNRFFRVPTEDEAKFGSLPIDVYNSAFNEADGFNCAQLKTLWSASLADDTDTSAPASGGSLDLMSLNRQYAELHTEQERTHFLRYYADVVESFGGKASRDSEFRPHLLMHTEQWASGYDVDGTSTDTMGQFSGRVQQTFQHEVPRFFVPEHGQIITLALARFPPTMIGEQDYLDRLLSSAGAASYDLLAGDSAIVANSPPMEINLDAVIGDAHNPFNESTIKIPHSQWYRYQRSHVDNRFKTLDGFPFIDTHDYPPQSNLRYCHANLYRDIFQTNQLGDWNIQSKFNVNVIRDLPTARDAIMTN